MDSASSESDILSETKTLKTTGLTKVRNLVGFWLLGLCNNYPYVIMLSAAFDILHPKNNQNDPTQLSNETNITNETVILCNPTSTGAILLADILPALVVKLLAPFFFQAVHLRIILVVLLSSSSFLLTSLSSTSWMSFSGVICASLSSGLGEVTILSFSSFFDKNVVSTWSSGTGGAGVLGALSYASLAALVGPRSSLQIMLIFPIAMAAVFWVLLVHPEKTKLKCFNQTSYTVIQPYDMTPDENGDDFELPHLTTSRLTFREKIYVVSRLLRYMIPLGLVYFAEYFINQGLLELIYFKNTAMKHDEQYRWFQVAYQVGVLISRSSVNIIHIKKLWMLPILQIINAIFMIFVVYYMFLPSIWIVVVIILYEGLLGGASYVNTFFSISQNAEPSEKEFSLGVTALSDSVGIALAGAIALPTHDALCRVLES